MGLVKQKVNVPVCGLGRIATCIKYKMNALISNENSFFTHTVDFLVVSKIMDFSPISIFDVAGVGHPLTLVVDPFFDRPEKIDLIIGAESFIQMLKDFKLGVFDNLIYFRFQLLFLLPVDQLGRKTRKNFAV